MLDHVLRASLRYRWAVLVAALGIMVLGVWRTSNMPVDVFPDLTAPRVTILTESEGMAPEEIERLITFPIETTVNGVAGVRQVRSASSAGLSLVWVEFDWDTTSEQARQRVTERLQGLSGLPLHVDGPILTPPSSVMGEIAFIGFTAPELEEQEFRRMIDVEVRRRLLAIRGVSQVIALGGHERQYQVLADHEKLERFDITLDVLTDAITRGNQNAPGGYLIEKGQESVIRVLGRSHSTQDLGQITIEVREGVPILVRDVAEVVVGHAIPRGSAGYNGQPAIILSIVKQPNADTLVITQELDATLDGLTQPLSQHGIHVHRDLFRQAEFIEVSLNNLTSVLRDGALLVVLVLLIFLWSLRPTIISALALPLSLLLSVLVLDLLGLSLDVMTLGGMAIAIGVLVDDAIVDVENVTRRLRDRKQLPEEERPPVLKTILDASIEIRSSIVSATFILMLVFVPLLLLDGIEGRLLRPLAIAYLAAIGSSLVVAMTLTPALCAFLLPKVVEKESAKEPPVLRWLSRLYEPALSFSLRKPKQVVLGAVLFTAGGAIGLSFLGRSFLPEFNEGSLTIAAVTLPGTSLEESAMLATLAEKALLTDPAVVSTGRRTGRAEKDEHVQGPESSEIDVRLRSDPRTKQELLQDIRAKLDGIPGMRFNVGQPLSHRIDHMLSGQRAAIAIKVVGDDLSLILSVANKIGDSITDIPGLVDLNIEQMLDVPQVLVRIDHHAASQVGLSPGAAAHSVSTALWGFRSTQIYEHGYLTDVVVKYPDRERLNIETIARTRIPTPEGASVPLSAIAEVRRDLGKNYILRDNVQRRVVVSANAAGRDLGSVADDVRERVGEQIVLPPGIHVEYAGQFEREEATSTRLMLLGGLVVLGIGLIVGLTLHSIRRTFIVLSNLPMALTGGVLGVYLVDGVLSVATLIGFISLFGIATRNGILLATRTRDLELDGILRKEAVEQAARERLAPILMTAITAALGLIPLAMALGQPGSEIQAPMAVVILTGLATSTALNMVVVPALLSRWGGDVLVARRGL